MELEHKIPVRAILKDGKGCTILDNPISAGLDQLGFMGSGTEREDPCASRLAGTNSRGGILEHDAITRSKADTSGAQHIGFRMGLAVRNVSGSNEMFWQRQACGANAHFGERTSAGGHYCPAIRGERVQELESAGKRDDVSNIFDFTAFDVAILGRMIRIGKKFADGCEAGASVRHAHDGIRIEAMFERPAGPDARNRGGGVHQYAIQIE